MRHTTEHPRVSTDLLIRRPAKDLYESFVDPNLITKFWLSKSSARLEMGKKIRWDFKIKGATAELEVKALEVNKRIVIEWDDGIQVEWLFSERPDQTTIVTIILRNLAGNPKDAMAYAIDSISGFTLVLCELKALLEKNVSLNLMYDKFPDAAHL